MNQIKPINIIIGRNNAGKSSLVDAVKHHPHHNDSSQRSPIETFWCRKYKITPKRTEILLIDENPPYVTNNIKRRKLPIDHYTELGITTHNDTFIEILWNNKSSLVLCNNEDITAKKLGQQALAFQEAILNHYGERFPLVGSTFFDLQEDRRIVAERIDSNNNTILADGSGTTNIIARFMHSADLREERVTQDMLNSLNKIFSPDAHFNSISTKLIGGSNDLYEIFLNEDKKGDIALSDSGRGLQTVIIILSAIYLLPDLSKYRTDRAEWVFTLEEIENTLHPSLQRRLFSFLRDWTVSSGAVIFATTHSHVVIDLFANDKEAQILHVTHDGTNARVTPVLAHAGRRGVLDDLDVRASDLLQANSIVWVEGPTDRLYFNRWIELWTGGELQEGRDYQCVFYGGRLLSHLDSEEPSEVRKETIEILRVNNRAILLMDSDKKSGKDPLGETKQRLISEVENTGGYAWVTQGREVEHYIPRSAFEAYFGKELRSLRINGNVLEYLNKAAGKPERKSYDKFKLAKEMIPLLTRDNLEGHRDLNERMKAVVEQIREWNSRPPEPAP